MQAGGVERGWVRAGRGVDVSVRSEEGGEVELIVFREAVRAGYWEVGCTAGPTPEKEFCWNWGAGGFRDA